VTFHNDPVTEPTEQRRRLAALLGRLRQASGLSQTEFGARVGMNQPKVSRLETARQLPTAEEAQAWAGAASADDAARSQLQERMKAALVETTSFANELRHGFAVTQARIGRAERTTSVVRAYSLIVPGLLQTAEYARRLINMQAELHDGLFGDTTDALAAWMDRQQALYRPGGRYEFVVPESALRWRPDPDGAAVLIAQLHHLAAATRLPSVRFGVIPENVGPTPAVPHDFTMFGEPGKDPDVQVEIYTTTRPLRIREPAELATYRHLWSRLVDQAVFDDHAQDLLAGLADALAAQ
jgi:transcriptional regulator with XRE-family HTH domain